MCNLFTCTSSGKWSGQDDGWVRSLIHTAVIGLDPSIIKYPSIKRFPGGASNDLQPNLANPGNLVPALDPNHPFKPGAGAGFRLNDKISCRSF